ncbi:MAG: hypothetical protein K0R62_6254 [Nonomuraea muscovyensis]|nr:hypothetical protein [Nonomuraea muscovyensis]
MNAYAPLHGPEDTDPDVHTVDLALRMAREAIDRAALKNVHSQGQMLMAAIELDFALRQLVTAVEAERGERQ